MISEQLNEIRKSSLARLMCDNADHLFTMQPRAFERVSERYNLNTEGKLELRLLKKKKKT